MRLIWLSTVIIICLSKGAYAKDFGQYGTSFIIKEEGFISMIKRRLAEIDIQAHQQKLFEQAKAQVLEPKAVGHLSKTLKPRSFDYDPTYTVPEDIILPGGTLLYARGHKVNPLENFALESKLYFIDSKDAHQVEWFRINAAEADKLVLTAGRPSEVGELLGQDVYFDQFGELSAKIGIKQVPAYLEQQGQILKVHEVKIDG